MKMPRLASSDRRAIALGALAVAPVLLYTGVLRPFRTALAETRDRVASQRALLDREVALLSESGQFPASLRRGESTLMEEAPRLFGGTDALAASAALSNYVSARALSAHVFMQGSDTRPPVMAADGVVALGIEIHAAGDLAGVLAFLRSLEDGPKLMRVDRITLERAVTYSNVASSGEEVLTLSAIVNGYSLAAPSPVPTGGAP